MILNLVWLILFLTNRINGFQQITNIISKYNHKSKITMILNEKDNLHLCTFKPLII